MNNSILLNIYFLFFLIIISLISGFMLASFPILSEPDSMRVLILMIFIFITISVVIFSNSYSSLKKLYYSIGVTIWGVLIISESFLVRGGSIEKAYESKFSFGAYGELIVWIICGFILFLISIVRQNYLNSIFKKEFKPITIFLLLTFISILYSPSPLYSLSWSFKLLIIIISLAMFSYGIENLNHIYLLLKILYIFLFIIAIAPFFQIFINVSTLFKGYRFGGLYAPTSVSAKGGLVFLFFLILYKINKKKIYYITGVIGLIIALLGGGKAAIIATIISASFYFIILDGISKSISFIFLFIFLLFVSFFINLPFIRYIQFYQEAGLLVTFTGRTDLWISSIHSIIDKPFMGHGYLSSKFAFLFIQGVWWKAGHMHNSILEILYNNGIVGLIPILIMNYKIIKYNKKIIKNSLKSIKKILAIGLLTLYLYLFINGLFTTSFGGRPHSGFMLFLLIFILSEKLILMENEKILI